MKMNRLGKGIEMAGLSETQTPDLFWDKRVCLIDRWAS